MQTWSTSSFGSDSTVAMLPGEWGVAASGTRSSSRIVTVRSYSASGSAFTSAQSFPRPCASRKAFVVASLGKIEVVTPHSAPMFVIVDCPARSARQAASAY
jgi:hypothetical protein